jgi:hypothetical protein
MPGGRITTEALTEPVEAALTAAYGAGHWIVGTSGSALYLNRDLVREKHLDEAVVEVAAARAVAAVPHVARVFTREQLLRGDVPPDRETQRILRGFHAARSGDLEILLEPYWIREAKGTTHGSPYEYDAHIPLVLMGPGILPGSYLGGVALNDLAPTLAALLGVEPPSGSAGRVLTEALTR